MTQPQPERREPVMDEDDGAKRLREHAASLQVERDALLARVERLRAALEKVQKAKRWTHNVITARLMQDKDGPWVMVDHKEIRQALAADTAAAKEVK